MYISIKHQKYYFSAVINKKQSFSIFIFWLHFDYTTILNIDEIRRLLILTMKTYFKNTARQNLKLLKFDIKIFEKTLTRIYLLLRRSKINNFINFNENVTNVSFKFCNINIYYYCLVSCKIRESIINFQKSRNISKALGMLIPYYLIKRRHF